MFNKIAYISMWLILVAFTTTTIAGGEPTHDHKHSADESVSEPMEMPSEEHAGHKMPAMEHGEGHEHDSEGSTVGQPATESAATKTIAVTTLDTMRFIFLTPPDLKAGDIVKFVITNKGKIPHEFSIGDEKEQQAHGEMMRQMPDMVHQDGNTVTVKPGETKVLTWEFKSGDVVFACNVPGHFEAGMFHKVSLN